MSAKYSNAVHSMLRCITPSLQEDCYQKWLKVITGMYSEAHRHYHTLQHIDGMSCLWNKFKAKLKQPELVGHAIIFHDIVYNPKATDNEEQSADLFKIFAKEIHMERDNMDTVVEWILSTKQHQTKAHTTRDLFGRDDIHYFLDFDMAILGRPRDEYLNYAEQIRLEYSHIPLEKYKSGRSQVLRTFLQSANIFATEDFRESYEESARENLAAEIRRLEEV